MQEMIREVNQRACSFSARGILLGEQLLHPVVLEFLASELHNLRGQDLKPTPFKEGPCSDACLRKKSHKVLAASRGLEAVEQRGGNTAAFVFRMHVHMVEVSRRLQISKAND